MGTEQITATPVQAGMRLSTSQLIDVLKEGKVGDVKTDEKLKEICGRDTAPGGDGYGNLASAIRHVQRNYGITWKRVVGAGCIKCLSSTEKDGVVESNRKHISRVAKRSIQIAKTIDINELPESDRQTAIVKIVQMQAIGQFSSTQTTKKLAARNVTSPPDVSKLLEAFQ